MVDLNRLLTEFKEDYGATPRLFSAPGRVNIIGEHTDYNDGFVLPMAINRRTHVAIGPREDTHLRIRSLVLNAAAEADLEAASARREQKWINYVAGVSWILEQRGVKLRGADILIDSEVPIGGGLSSSAALEIATGLAMTAIAEVEVEPVQLAQAAQEAEHKFAGAKVGIMDQLTATLGKKDHALLIDCRSLEVKPISLAKLDATIVVCNTNVKHDLASSAYNERRAECERGVEILSKKLPHVRALRDVSIAEFENYETDLPEPIRRRCRHVITENDRTLKAAEALESGDRETLGELMRQSHESLKNDYEVSSRELDLMVGIAGRSDEVFGARMTGGGFGGCTINIVSAAAVEEFQQLISREYRDATGIVPDIYVVAADDGAREERVSGPVADRGPRAGSPRGVVGCDRIVDST